MKKSIFIVFAPLFIVLSSCNQEAGFQNLSLDNDLRSSHTLPSQTPIDSVEIETFELHNKRAGVDFLILPDSSQSMFHRLKSVGQSLSDLLHVISSYDWQIGFSSTDHGDYHYNAFQANWKEHTAEGQGRFGTLMNMEDGTHFLQTRILTPTTRDYKKVFLHTLSHIPRIDCKRPPFCSNPMEQPLRSLKSAIERAESENRYLFRHSSDYFISFIITNEEERKEDFRRATQPEEVISAFNRQFQGLNKKFLHYSLLIKDKDCLFSERQNNPSASISHSAMKLSELTGGISLDLCSGNYGSELRVISQHIKNKVENSVFLKREPIPNSVKVTFLNGSATAWELKGNRLIFDNKHFENISISVSYQAIK